MVRKLIKVLLAGSILFPSLGFALGLGDIHLYSGLNQQLNAEIDLLSVDPSETDKINVSLASYDTFTKLGVDRPPVLRLMSFEVQKRSNGTPYIRVRSKELINEPFLDFLVEVTWPSGKVLREYTLLLDPPEMTGHEPLMVEAPQMEETPAVDETPQAVAETEPLVSEPLVSAPVDMADEPAGDEPAGEEIQQAADETAPSTPESAAQEETVSVAQAEPESAEAESVAQAESEQTGAAADEPPVKTKSPRSPAASEAVVYGPVKRNEALWRIADRMRPDDSVSVDQMMIALFNANREAFIKGNINLLRKGAVLRIDDPAELRALSHAEARREVARHGRAWDEYRTRVAASTPKSVTTDAASKTAENGGTVASAAATKEEPKLSLVAPGKEGEGKQAAIGGTSGKSAEAESLRKELQLANESAEAHRKENEELNKRLKELEGQIQSMQKLLTLKDDNLTAMQQKLAEQQKQPASPNGAAQPVTPPLVEPAKSPEAAAQETKTPEKEAVTPTEPVATATEAVPAPTEGAVAPAADAASETAKPAAEQPKPKIRNKPKVVLPPVQPEPGFIDEALKLFDDPMMLGVGGAGLLILILGIMLVMKRRRQGRGFQESILTVGASSSMMKGKGDNPASETSFLSDLAISGMGGRVQSEEADVDPLTEADVYMAYNRFPQAEDLLKEGLKHNPERDDLNAKLLEVYYKSKNKQAFEELAQARAGTMQGNPSLWGKVVAMGQELSPGNPLFKGAAAAGGAALFAGAAKAESPAASDVFDIGLDLDALSSEMEASGAGGSDFNVDLGLDFSDLGTEDSAKKKSDEPVAELSGLDLDLGGTNETPDDTAASTSLDFDLSGFGSEQENGQSLTTEPVNAEESLLGGLDFDLSSMAEETAAAEEPAASLDFGDFDLASTSGETSATEAENTLDFGSLDLGGSTDELSFDTGSKSIDFGSMDLGGASEEPAAITDMGDFGDLGDLGDFDDSSLSGMDEIGTKLDLAKAYMDMGDPEGARSMLEEVIQDGSGEQKEQAQTLLNQIA